MAPKKTVKKAPKKAPKPETREPEGQTEPGQDVAPTITKADEKKLLRDLAAAEKDAATAKEMVNAAEAKVSDAIKAIFDALGSGPFEIGGRRVNISSRNDTYFFKGERQGVRVLG